MPLSMPSTPKFRESTFGLQFNTNTFQSPMTRQTQVVERAGARWQGSFTLPPMKRVDAAAWIAFLAQCKGQAVTFYGFDPDATTPQGVGTGTPTVSGGSQTGSSLVTTGWTAGQTGIMKAGDYFQVNGELKMVTVDANSDGSGNATIQFQPALRSSPANGASITVNNPKCLMMLTDDGQASWSADSQGVFSIQFSGVEVI